MTTDERARRALYARLADVLGPEQADTLMQTLPPFPSTDLATGADLEILGDRIIAQLGRRMDRLEERMDRLEKRMDRLEKRMEKFDDRLHGFHILLTGQVRQFVIAQAGVLIALVAVFIASLQLLT